LTTRIADDPLAGTRRLFRRLAPRTRPDHLPGSPPCRVLVGGSDDAAAVAGIVALALGLGDAVETRLRSGGLVIRVDRNADAGQGDAGRWALAVEIAPSEPVTHPAFVEAVEAVLRGLRGRDLRTVTFWAFADDLPSSCIDRKGPGRRI
jgi:hypothetical protein